MHTQKNRLQQQTGTRYASRAPHKTGAGISTPLTTQAHNRASGFFVRTASPRLFCVNIMVGRTGPTSVGPGSCVAGCGNPVRLTTPSFPPLDGEFSQLTTQGATPWQTVNSAALSRSVVTSRPKSTADLPARPTSPLSCNATPYTGLTTLFRQNTTLPFSAIWRTISPRCKTSLTSTDNQHEAILGPFAGGFRTPVVGRIAP